MNLRSNVLRNGIISGTSPWVASAYASDGKPRTLQRTMFAYSFNGILAAGWSVAASRRQHRRYGALIETYRNYQHRSEYPGYYVFLLLHCYIFCAMGSKSVFTFNTNIISDYILAILSAPIKVLQVLSVA